MPIHPAVAARFPLLDGIPSFRAGYADPAMRARIQQFEAWPDGDVPVVATRSDAVPGPHGDVPVRIYLPGGDAARRPGLVWVHGGAFVGGDLDMAEADWTAREVCAAAGAVVVSVDYRLARDGVCYPVPHDDVVAAVRWARDHAADLGIDAKRFSIGGASAGANLSAGAALRLRDDDGWLPAALLLVYPVLHAVLPPASPTLATALAEVPGVFRMRPEDRAAITANYLGGPPSSADGYAMPGSAVLDGLCPTVVVNGEYDDLRASGETFAAQLAVSGVDVRTHTARGMLHGFLNLPRELEPVGRVLDLLTASVDGTDSA